MNALAFHDFDCMTLADHQVESAEFNGKLNQESKAESGGIFLSSAFYYGLWTIFKPQIKKISQSQLVL